VDDLPMSILQSESKLLGMASCARSHQGIVDRVKPYEKAILTALDGKTWLITNFDSACTGPVAIEQAIEALAPVQPIIFERTVSGQEGDIVTDEVATELNLAAQLLETSEHSKHCHEFYVITIYRSIGRFDIASQSSGSRTASESDWPD